MVYKRFYTGVLIRVVLLVVTCLAFSWAYIIYQDWLISLNGIALLLFETFLLIRYVNRTNRDLAQFFLSVKNEDTTLSYTKKSYGHSFDNLYKQLDRLNEHIRNIKTDLVNQELFNKIIISHINTGIMVIDANGKVTLHNLALSNLFSIPVINSVFQLDNLKEGFSRLFLNISPGQRITHKIPVRESMKEILIRASEYRTKDQSFKLISVQDIRPELDEKEMESWQKLIRILTHEITNSIGPINSTINTIADFFILNDHGVKELVQLNQKNINDTVKGIQIIRERSSGLLDFVQRFRDLTLIPKPNRVKIPVVNLFDHIKTLMTDDLYTNGISLTCVPAINDLCFSADKSMVEQVMINLVRNASESGCKKIHLEAGSDENRIWVKVGDDGRGIERENIENIFVPFFTTKETGSGIGLSLSREIMRLHGGTIDVNSEPGKGTVFTLNFKI